MIQFIAEHQGFCMTAITLLALFVTWCCVMIVDRSPIIDRNELEG